MGNSLKKSKGTRRHEEKDKFFETFSSIRLSYKQSQRRIKPFKFHTDEVDNRQTGFQLRPSINELEWNVDDLYTEVLHALNSMRHLFEKTLEPDSLVAHLQQIFQIDNDKHSDLLGSAKKTKARWWQVESIEKASDKYKHVLYLMLVHELHKTNAGPHQWKGVFSDKATAILTTLQLKWELSKTDIHFAQWIVYTKVHCKLPLNTMLFPPLLQRVIVDLQKKGFGEEKEKQFWQVTERIVENFMALIRNLWHCTIVDNSGTSQIDYILRTLEILKQFLIGKLPFGINNNSKVTADFITDKMEIAISHGANDFFNYVVQLNCDEPEMEQMIKIAQLLIQDLNEGLGMYHSVFKTSLNVNSFDILYQIYDEKFYEIVQPVVAKICDTLKDIDLRNDEDGSFQEMYISTGSTLFVLYLAIKDFANHSSKLSRGDDQNKKLCIAGMFHNWFETAVSQWFDIAWFKAEKFIRKAVELDTFTPSDDYVQFSSSALDTGLIFHQIQISWNELCWPEVERSYSFTATFLDDLCRCTMFYADLMCKKAEEMEKQADKKYKISDELCMAINNIERVAEEMSLITHKLDMSRIIQELEEKNGAGNAKKCLQTLVAVVENAKENVDNKISYILESIGMKMQPVIQKLLLEAIETNTEGQDTKRLVKYLGGSLMKLSDKLKPATFDKIFSILWTNVSHALLNLVTAHIENKIDGNTIGATTTCCPCLTCVQKKQGSSGFFKWIQDILQVLTFLFYPDGSGGQPDSVHNSNIQEIEKLIRNHGSTTPELIIKYYQQRYQTQVENVEMSDQMDKSPSLTIRTDYCEDIQTLRIEILNARNLKPLHGANSDQCYPYVKIKLVQEDNFASASTLKTNTQKKTLFPLFDELLFIPLSPEKLTTGGFIMFSLKDHAKLGRKDLLGECFLPLDSILISVTSQNTQQLKQTHLPLTLPQEESNSDVLETLEGRLEDKSVVKFVKIERSKILLTSYPISQQ